MPFDLNLNGMGSRLFILLNAVVASSSVHDPKVVSHISFGSCNMHDRRQPLWSSIVATKPDMFIWLGDAVYGDTAVAPGVRRPAVSSDLEEKYAAQKAHPEYQHLLANVPQIYGVWDDHDFGKNNGGAEYSERSSSQSVFLDFIGDAPDSPRRSRPGTYSAHTFGPKGKRVTLILLDVRYFRDGGGVLGEAQWAWFEKVLRERADSNLVLIGSGIQVLAPDRVIAESWNQHPQERARLFDTLRNANLAGVPVLLSGDVHFAELSCIDAGLSPPSPFSPPLNALTHDHSLPLSFSSH